MDTTAVIRTLCLLAASLTAPACAQTSTLIVVEDRGGDSALPYYQMTRNSNRIRGGTLRQATPPALPFQPSAVANGRTMPQFDVAMFPLRTSRLQTGTFERKTHPAPPGAKPFFVIGDDATSRAWLQDWHGTLRQAGAVGFVVEANDAQAFQSLRELASGLHLMPASGDELATRFGLKTYPVLIVPSAWPGHADLP